MSGLRLRTGFILAAMAGTLGVAGCKSNDATPAASPGASAVAATVADSPRAENAAAEVAHDDRPLIVCFGDSLTAGLGVESEQSYPADLQKRLDAVGYRYRVVNAGVSGNTTKDGVARLQHVVEKKPEIVVLEFGGNDGLRGLPLTETKQNLATMIDGLQKSGAKVALAGITLPPQYGADYIARFDAMYPALAKRFSVPLLPFLLQDVYGTTGGMQQDGIHATEQGNQQVAANVQKLIAPLLKK